MYTLQNLFSNQSVKPAILMKRVASIGGSVSPMTLCGKTCASTEASPRDAKIRLINVVFLRTLSEIKLKRTDTTLDLSQKAKRAEEEKKKSLKSWGREEYLYSSRGGPCDASGLGSLIYFVPQVYGRYYCMPQALYLRCYCC
jgi:hypothetical protein